MCNGCYYGCDECLVDVDAAHREDPVTHVTTTVTHVDEGYPLDELAVPEFSTLYDHDTMRPERSMVAA